MNLNVVEREMVYAKAGLADSQKSVVTRFIFSVTKKAFLGGVVFGFVLCAIGFIIGLFLF